MPTNVYLPPVAVALLVIGLSLCREETVRWMHAKAQAPHMVPAIVGVFIDATAILSLAFLVAFFVAYGYDMGWETVPALVIAASLIAKLYGWLSARIGAGALLRLPATIAVWILAVPLALRVSWFGIF